MKLSLLVSSLFALLVMQLPCAADTVEIELTEAQIRVFESDHLKGLVAGTVLHYDFSKSGSLEKSLKDTVDIIVREALPDGDKNLDINFLTGDSKESFGQVFGFRGNPLIMAFLERDVREMKRLTGGASVFFRNRIRNAFAGDYLIKQISVDFGGRNIQATEITLRPYANTLVANRFKRFVEKKYIFVLSDEISGAVFRIAAVTPGESANAPLLEESVTFTGVETKP